MSKLYWRGMQETADTPVDEGHPLPVRLHDGATGVKGTYTNNALSTTPERIFKADTQRTRAVVKNIDASITVYVGDEQMTSSTGMPLTAGESITLHDTNAIWAVAASGTPSVRLLEERRA